LARQKAGERFRRELIIVKSDYIIGLAMLASHSGGKPSIPNKFVVDEVALE
jgi:hypothetical protein